MAKKRGPEKSVDDLRQEIAHSRDRLGRELTGLRYELDFPLKFRKSFQRNTKTWVSAVALAGVVMTARAIPTRRTTVKVKTGKAEKLGQLLRGEEEKKGILQAGLAMGALKFAATLLKPLVVSFVTKKVGSYARR